MSEMPSNFKSIIIDFTNDLSTVFPEYQVLWAKWMTTASEHDFTQLHQHCLAVFPERFFDILYTNSDIFSINSKINVFFLPDVDFRLLFNCHGISENTKTSIWKYLQLILFTVLGSVKNATDFGDSADIFSAMKEDDLQHKMAEAMEGINAFFNNETNMSNTDTNTDIDTDMEEGAQSFVDGLQKTMEQMGNMFDTDRGDNTNDNTNEKKTNGFKIPDMEELHGHLKGILEGKIGKLAQEFTEEFTSDLKDLFDENETDDVKSSKDVLMKIIKDPKKMMVIMKKLTDKLQAKMKSGEISQEELMAEMAELMEKMKGMGNNGEFADMMKGMSGLPFMKMLQGLGGAGAGQIDMNAMNRMSKQSALKERLRNKMEAKKLVQTQQHQSLQHQSLQHQSLPYTKIVETNTNEYIFQVGDEKQEKSGLKPPSMTEDELIAFMNAPSDKKTKHSKPKNHKSKK